MNKFEIGDFVSGAPYDKRYLIGVVVGKNNKINCYNIYWLATKFRDDFRAETVFYESNLRLFQISPRSKIKKAGHTKMSFSKWFKKLFSSKKLSTKKTVFTKLPFQDVHEAYVTHSTKALKEAAKSFFEDNQDIHGWTQEEFAQAYELAVSEVTMPRYLN